MILTRWIFRFHTEQLRWSNQYSNNLIELSYYIPPTYKENNLHFAQNISANCAINFGRVFFLSEWSVQNRGLNFQSNYFRKDLPGSLKTHNIQAQIASQDNFRPFETWEYGKA